VSPTVIPAIDPSSPPSSAATPFIAAARTHVPPTIVGVGASAGGLEAFVQLLQALPNRTNLAFVFVQHLAPQYESSLPTLIGSKTQLRVVPASEDQELEAHHVYVIPPDVHIHMNGGRLHLVPRPYDRTQYTPVDFFFQSLAHAQQSRAIGIILSGTASDGASGIREIKAAGGITIAQKPETARYDGMPRAAIATGMVDLMLSPSEIAARLIEVQSHPYLAPSAAPLELAMNEEQSTQLFTLLRQVSGIDFKQYKVPTVRRRLMRRMALHRFTDLSLYVRHLRSDRQELVALSHDLLIHVTRFFREPESFVALGTLALPTLLERAGADRPLRIWVPGCATGEEAYSVSIAVIEALGEAVHGTRVQIFASDVSEGAIEHARAGVYTAAIAADLSSERLKRFFQKTDGGYKVSKTLRDMCVFARHDLTRDPPFSRLDLVVCRNVLIYFDGAQQKRLMSIFHYALQPNGYLMLGPAETAGQQHLFSVVDKKWRLYRKTDIHVGVPADLALERFAVAAVPGRPAAEAARADHKSVHDEANRVLLQKYGPPGVVVDSNLQVVRFRGQVGPYLEPPAGEPSLSVLKMAREGMLYSLRTALYAARSKNRAVRKEGVHVRSDDGWRVVNLEVLPLTGPGSGHLLVLFEAVLPQPPNRSKAREKAAGRERDERVEGLTRELAASREYLQSIIQELEAANEELQSANEEVLSSNEELQSTNEELDTAKEELQSTNEELNTVNEELHSRNDELSRANSDLVNLLASVEITIAIVGADMRIRRFTPMAERVLNLIPTDIGRRIGQINPSIVGADLEALMQASVDQVTMLEQDVQDRNGHWYSLRIRPYKSLDNRIDGAVLALIDIDMSKRHQELERSAGNLLAMVEAVSGPLTVLDGTLQVRRANRAFYQRFGGSSADTEGKSIHELNSKPWNTPSLRELIHRVERTGEAVDDAVVDAPLEERAFTVNIRRVEIETIHWIVVGFGGTGDGSQS
jgi:two-component system CheB/CheR fusion protein